MNYTDKIYILKKYSEFGHYTEDDWFNPNINPDNGLISKCSQCNIDYENFKTRTDKRDGMEIEWKHPSSCLWFDYFTDKVRDGIKKPKFVKKIK